MDFAINWTEGLDDITKLTIAYLLVLPVGWYREREAHSVGVRTFPVVAVASCGLLMLMSPAHDFDAAARSRVLQGLIAGIGFIGGGAILKSEGSVRGTATAASILNTGVVGAAVALDRYLLAAMLAALNLIALRVLLPLKLRLDAKADEKRRDVDL